MPLTSTIDPLSLSPLRGMANAMLANAMLEQDSTPNAILEARPDSAMLKKAPFPRSARLLRHADFERVYKQGRRHFSASLTAFYFYRPYDPSSLGGPSSLCGAGTPAREAVPQALPTPQGLRVGFTVSRALGGAVDRNRMKRRLREAVRLSHPPINISADVVINPKKSLLTADFPAIVNEVTRAFAVIEQKLPRS